ncbi:hypothetical protein LGQ03_09540 [Loktanella sp. TSTF-M6]|uniref:Phosphoribosyl-AMP cyclohydrolase n=1 Tax=Loktanella gaetbuli TaxID=2881335 RepID=A0ABS8BUR2_9RHOB|nr:hypothetical protein [Loktanella gaetbuli]MCB5199482.1 hypothetical protein [Loktanella gaetbuli]
MKTDKTHPRTLAAATVIAFAASNGAVFAADPSGLTREQITAVQTAWGHGIVNIDQIHADGGDYPAAATDHISTFYAYKEDEALFYPTPAAEDQFHGSFDEALFYFVGDDIAEDGGFATALYTNVCWENTGTIISGDTAMAMGNYFFTTTDGSEAKVAYTFGDALMENGAPKIVLHHASLPYSPS